MQRSPSTAGLFSIHAAGRTTTWLVAGRLMALLRWLALAFVLAGSVSPALAAKTYSDNGDGTVTDPTTGLTWMRCSMGQTWDGVNATCTGTASTYTFDQANALTGTVTFAGQSDWRLPNIRELQTIVDRSVHHPAIDAKVFPNTSTSVFWSASAYASSSYGAWGVDFIIGGASDGLSQSNSLHIRLVRGGQSLGLLDINRPNADYVDQGNGTVMHKPTRLIWQRCAVGQSWTGATCSGTPSAFSWDVAKALTSNFADQIDWHLPTPEELLSMVDYGKSSPSINSSIFPMTSASPFWSSSLYAGDSYDAWFVNFNSGYASGLGLYKYSNHFFRLVRGGLCFGSLALGINRTGTGQITSRLHPSTDTTIACDTVAGATGYYADDVVTLTASPAANLILWGGACTGSTATCTVTMDAAKTVTATFKDTGLVTGLPNALTFASQNIASTSVAQTVTLTNTGTAALNISSISASGDFAVSNNCGAGIGAGGSCTLNVTFKPTASGTRTGTVTLATDAPGSPHSISLSGNGQGALASLSATSKTFASQNQGSTSAVQTITLTNTGGAVLNISSIAVSGDFANTITCGTTLAPAASCSISVTFKPTTVGALSGSVVITSDASNSPNTVTLAGTGLAVPVLTANPSSLSFDATALGSTSAAQSLQISNTGGAALSLSSINASGDFAVTNNCGSGLGAGGFCNLSVTFTPTAAGSRTGAVTITSNAPDSPKTLSLTGTGVAVAATQPFNVSAVAGAGQATISFAGSLNNGGSAVTGYTVTSTPAGGVDSQAGTTALTHTVTGLTNGTPYTFTVVATNGAGDSAASAASNSVTPVQGSQLISFGSAPMMAVGGAGTVSATGGASGNAVTFTSTTPTICTAGGTNGSTVTALAAGNCTIAANQAGNANYTAAPQAAQTITIAQTGIDLLPGWNLLGNATDQPLAVAAVFVDKTIINTVWKWDVTAMGWQFFTPTLSAAALQTYATGKNYAVLSAINPGEGFWVNVSAKSKTIVPAFSGAPFYLGASQLVTGWNLMASADEKTPSQLNAGLSSSLAAANKSISTLWSWNVASSAWQFYAPTLEANGQLASYIAAKSYLPFTSALAATDGFWVNISTPTLPSTPALVGAEGVYAGTMTGALSSAFQMLILENGEYWSLYGTQYTSAFYVSGVAQGVGVANNGSFTSTNFKDFGYAPALAGTVNATYSNTAKTISGTISSAGGSLSFSGSPIAGSLYDYNKPASLSAIAGAWSATGLGSETVALNILSNGTFAATSSLGCHFSGTFAPRASGKNVFNVTLTFGSSPCALPGVSGSGIAIASPLANGKTQLITAAIEGSRNYGAVMFGTR